MSLEALSDYVYVSKYARYNKEKKRRELWQEAVDRVRQMHLRKYPQVEEEINWAFDRVLEKRVLGSQRALQFGGRPIESVNARIYNCTASYCDRIRFFQEALFLLLAGCGVGFSVQKHHVAKLPRLFKPTKGSAVFKIPDSIEGWADSLGVLIDSYLNKDSEYFGYIVEFDYHLIRRKGSPISSGIGKAPGPDPLRFALENIRRLLNRCIEAGQKFLRPIDAYDIVMHSSDAVLSGGVRRSACITLFSPDDLEMARAKTGNWFYKNPQRARSNNSALLIRNKTTREEFKVLMACVKEFGEPGFVWADSMEYLVNPCLHRDSRVATTKGLVKIEDLYNEGQSNLVIVDNRVGQKDEIKKESGVSCKSASKVYLTQKDADIFELVTKHGFRIKATANHEFPTKNGRKRLSDLKPGDILFFPSGKGCFGDLGIFEQGLALGMITGDGTLCGDHAFIDIWEQDFDQLDSIENLVNGLVEKESHNHLLRRGYTNHWIKQRSSENGVEKCRIGGALLCRMLISKLGIEKPSSVKDEVPEIVWRGSEDFVRGYLQGLFFADGTVGYSDNNRKKKATLTLRLGQSNERLLLDIQQLLMNFGVVSNVHKRRESGMRSLPDGCGGRKEYYCKDFFELIINRPNLVVFMQRVGLFGRKKEICETLLQLRGLNCRKPERFITCVKSINYVGKDDVFCLYEQSSNSFVANGMVVGNCCEIGMYAYDEYGNPGWQACNLCEINGKMLETREDFEIASRGGAIIGTLQAGYTDLPYLGEVSERIFKREALLGVSITGMMENPHIVFDVDLQREMAWLIKDVNGSLSERIGINPAARCTCVKPSGTTSSMLGTSSGIHPHHSKIYFRRVQGNNNEAPLVFFSEINPNAVESSVWSANKTDYVITFCVEVQNQSALTKKEIGAVELLEYVKLTQQNWVQEGTRSERCVQPWLRHNVSNTINVKLEEWDTVEDYIYDNREFFAGIALLPSTGDLDYPQAPFCAVSSPKEIVAKYGDGSIFASGLIVDGLHAYNDLWKACDAVVGRCQPQGFVQEDWIRRANQFAQRYFNGDVQKMLYCLKEVNNCKTYFDLKRQWKEVDYSMLNESSDDTNVAGEMACSGGSCEIF